MKTNSTIKKIFAMLLACAMMLAFAACGSSPAPAASEAPAAEDDGTVKVAIIKQLDHASLDEIANAIAARFDEMNAAGDVRVEYSISSGQNDQTILKQLCDQAIADKVDVIVPVATTAAQVATLSAEGTGVKVVYAAISDPAAANLTGIDYVTGTSDALNTSFILDMMFAQNPDIKKVGLLYSLSEPNSATPIADAKAYLDAKNIEYVEQTANTNDEVVAAASALIAADVDAIFTPTDNTIMAAELAIYEDLAKAGIQHYTGADSFVRNGAFATCGVNYTELGRKTAELAVRAVSGGSASGLLPHGRRHHHRQHRDRRCPRRGLLRVCRHGRAGRSHYYQGLILIFTVPQRNAGGTGLKGVFAHADNQPDRAGTGLYVRARGDGTVSELSHP